MAVYLQLYEVRTGETNQVKGSEGTEWIVFNENKVRRVEGERDTVFPTY